MGDLVLGLGAARGGPRPHELVLKFGHLECGQELAGLDPVPDVDGDRIHVPGNLRMDHDVLERVEFTLERHRVGEAHSLGPGNGDSLGLRLGGDPAAACEHRNDREDGTCQDYKKKVLSLGHRILDFIRAGWPRGTRERQDHHESASDLMGACHLDPAVVGGANRLHDGQARGRHPPRRKNRRGWP